MIMIAYGSREYYIGIRWMGNVYDRIKEVGGGVVQSTYLWRGVRLQVRSLIVWWVMLLRPIAAAGGVIGVDRGVMWRFRALL